jgi:hypothetical protein
MARRGGLQPEGSCGVGRLAVAPDCAVMSNPLLQIQHTLAAGRTAQARVNHLCSHAAVPLTPYVAA